MKTRILLLSSVIAFTVSVSSAALLSYVRSDRELADFPEEFKVDDEEMNYRISPAHQHYVSRRNSVSSNS